MNISIKQLGPIKKAEIDLKKPIILFCGQNNTGKTYISYIIYALIKARIKIRRKPRIDVEQLLENGKLSINLDKNFLDQLFEWKKNIVEDIKDRLPEIFGLSYDHAKRLFEKCRIEWDESREAFAKQLLDSEIDREIRIGEHTFRLEKKKSDPFVSLSIDDEKDYSLLVKDGVRTSIFLKLIITRELTMHPIRDVVIFPVERNSIYTFSKELSLNRNLLVDRIQKISKGEEIDPFAFISDRSNRYPIAIRDGLRVAEDLKEVRKSRGSFYEQAESLERALLGGTLSVSKDGELQFTTNKRKSEKLPVHMTASLVKTLSSIVFYLKYQAEKGDLIIIDEPEMNLHPDNQITLAKAFGRLHNLGFRLMISTHSDYIIRELNLMIMSSKEDPSVQASAEKLGYDKEYQIKPESVGCYYYHFPKSTTRQVTVEPLPVKEDGIEIASIETAINDQNERMDALGYAFETAKANKTS